MSNEILAEKYRPLSVKDISGQSHIKPTLMNFVENKTIPHLLFYGIAGIGKTTTAISLGKDLLGETFAINFLELNASDERGIDTVREKVKCFARQQPIEAPFKIILLDECDALTPPAQNALRRTMEKYAKTCRFILCCNHISQLIDPLISRCSEFNFMPLEIDEIQYRLAFICKEEAIEFDLKALNYISEYCFGDIRKAIVRLQSVAINGKVTMDAVFSDTIEGSFTVVMKTLFIDKNWHAARQSIKIYKKEGGTIRELLLRILNYSSKNSNIVPEELMGGLSRILRNTDRDLILGVNEQIEIDSMIFDIIDLSSTE